MPTYFCHIRNVISYNFLIQSTKCHVIFYTRKVLLKTVFSTIKTMSFF